MKNLFVVSLLAVGSTGAFSQYGKVVIEVKGVDLRKGGELAVGFFCKENFPTLGKQSMGAIKEVNATTMEIVFEQVRAGEYAIAIFQDVDRNKNLKTNFVGLPTERIGFSNDVRIRFGPPSFDDAKITVENGKTKNLTVQLR
jgi:uncharacterized protein (DUF2141 family)